MAGQRPHGTLHLAGDLVADMAQAGQIPLGIEGGAGLEREGHPIDGQIGLGLEDAKVGGIDQHPAGVLGPLDLIGADEPHVELAVQHAVDDLALVGREDQLAGGVDVGHARALQLAELHLSAAQTGDGGGGHDLAANVLQGLDVGPVGPGGDDAAEFGQVESVAADLALGYFGNEGVGAEFRLDARVGGGVDVDEVDGRQRLDLDVAEQADEVEGTELEGNRGRKGPAGRQREVGGEGGVEFGVGGVEAADGQDSDLVGFDGFGLIGSSGRHDRGRYRRIDPLGHRALLIGITADLRRRFFFGNDTWDGRNLLLLRLHDQSLIREHRQQQGDDHQAIHHYGPAFFTPKSPTAVPSCFWQDSSSSL